MSFSLILVKKTEGTIFLFQGDQVQSISITEMPTNSSIEIELENEENKNKPSEAPKKRPQPLYEYLASNAQNYEEFAAFLTGAFALENLLYFVRVIVFRRKLLNIIANTDSDRKDEWMPKGVKWSNVFSLSFNFVDGVYESCQIQPNDTDSVFNTALDIYNQFVIREAMHEVNITAEQRDELDEFFKSNEHDIEEYLVIFNESLMEVYALMTTIYRFQYLLKSE